jgi:DNA-binding NtrC family response regulator
MNVVIVDDEGVVRDVLAAILTDNGFEVRTASSGQEGLDLLAAAPADFLITDLLMPHMNGTELLQQARRISPETKVILMSGHVDFEGTLSRSAQGAYATLSKPFDFRTLMNLLTDGTPGTAPTPSD